jgi:hypothetical protein
MVTREKEKQLASALPNLKWAKDSKHHFLVTKKEDELPTLEVIPLCY